MSDCIDCKDCIVLQAIPTCTTEITVCDDLGLTTAYQNTYVYIQDLATGRINRLTATVSGGQLVITPDLVFHPEVKYKVWVNANDEQPLDQEMFIIDNNEIYCAEFEVFRMFDDNHVNITQFNAIFKIGSR